jgi:FLVCR family MFS transporter 7
MCSIPVGLIAMWAGRVFGLRTAILIAGTTNAIGATIRFTSSFLSAELRFPVGICGQAIASIAYPFIMFLPTKVCFLPYRQLIMIIIV